MLKTVSTHSPVCIARCYSQCSNLSINFLAIFLFCILAGQHEQVGRTKAAEDRVSALESEVQAKEVELSGLQQQIKIFVAEKVKLEESAESGFWA